MKSEADAEVVALRRVWGIGLDLGEQFPDESMGSDPTIC